MSRLQENLDQATDLSQRILNLARNAEWAEMERLDRERLPLLQTLFNGSEPLADVEAFEDQIQAILALNEEALVVCSQARGGMQKKGRNLKLGRVALQAYRKQSSD
ncbi:MAG: flagellar protein FliT [Candidatus Thiodiazotropha sp.]